jgi:hypothetical protein
MKTPKGKLALQSLKATSRFQYLIDKKPTKKFERNFDLYAILYRCIIDQSFLLHFSRNHKAKLKI